MGAVCENRLSAVGLFNHSIDKETLFKAWMVQLLIPTLPKNSVVVMDNAAFHKSEEISNLLKENGHRILWLPPYSPDLNPIEHKWAWVKSIRNKLRINDIDDLFRIFINNKIY